MKFESPTEIRHITLPQGGTLEVEMLPDFVWKVSQHFGVPANQIDDDHIRMFVWGALNEAIRKAPVRDDGEPSTV